MTRHPLRIALAAGGTGGHLFPAEALGKELTSRGQTLCWITDERGAPRSQFLASQEKHIISARGLAGYGALGRLTGALSLGVGVFQARRILKDMQPDVVIGFGGYAAAPTLMAATHLGLKSVIHEQNAVVGRANRLFARRVDRICTTFDEIRRVPDGVIPVRTGLPVREAFCTLYNSPYVSPQDKDSIRLFVLGGSQGAAVFSHLVPAALKILPKALRSRISVTQQCRSEIIEQTRLAFDNCEVEVTLKSFFENVHELIADAHLVIARSGASTVNEVAIAGRPAIFVPYPYGADDHQTENAKAIAKAGGGWWESQDTLTAAHLAERLEILLTDPETLSLAAASAKAFAVPDAAKRLADEVEELAMNQNGDNAQTCGAA